MSNVVIREATLDDAATVATLFSEFNALLGADGLPEEDSYAPELIEVSTATMLARLERIRAVEQVFIASSLSLEGEGRGEGVETFAVAGLCCLRLVPYIGQDAPYAEVTQLYVRDAYKRRGIGAALLREAERRATAAGATCVHIITGRDNLDAQAFYHTQGYSSADVVFDKYFEAEASLA